MGKIPESTSTGHIDDARLSETRREENARLDRVEAIGREDRDREERARQDRELDRQREENGAPR